MSQYFIPFNGWVLFHYAATHILSICQLMGIWVASTSWLLWIILPWRLPQGFCEDICFISLGYRPGSGIAGLAVNRHLTFWLICFYSGHLFPFSFQALSSLLSGWSFSSFLLSHS
jgi:hypothetical protein